MPPDEHSQSLREALSASYDAAIGGDETSSGDGGGSSPAAALPDAQAAATTGPASPGQPARDPSGKFAPKAPADGAGAPPAAAADADMPEGYDAAIWGQLTPEARARTAEWAGKTRETLAEREERLKGYEPIEGVLGKRRDALKAQFGSEANALDQLFHLSDFAGRDPGGFIRWMAQQRGLNMQDLLQQQADRPQQQQQQADPAAALSQFVNEQLERREVQRDVDRTYTEFMAQTGLEHRDDPGVKRTMAALLQVGSAPDFKSAYDMAVQAHPTLGPKLRAAEAAAAAKAEGERRAEAAAAKAQAAVSTHGGPGTSRASGDDADPATIRDALNRAWDSQAGARV